MWREHSFVSYSSKNTVWTPAAVQHQCVNRDCWWLFGRSLCFVPSAYRKPRFPFTLSAKATGNCTTGRGWTRYLQDSAPTHFSRVVRHILNAIYHDWWIGRVVRYYVASTLTSFNPLEFYPWEQLKTLAYAAPADNEDTLPSHCEFLPGYQKLPLHLGTHARSMMCRGESWISRRTFWTLVINELFQP
jgi:hypothetical protein